MPKSTDKGKKSAPESSNASSEQQGRRNPTKASRPKFTSDQERDLILWYEDHPFLWSKMEAHYKDEKRKQAAFNMKALEYNCSGQQLRVCMYVCMCCNVFRTHWTLYVVQQVYNLINNLLINYHRLLTKTHYNNKPHQSKAAIYTMPYSSLYHPYNAQFKKETSRSSQVTICKKYLVFIISIICWFIV